MDKLLRGAALYQPALVPLLSSFNEDGHTKSPPESYRELLSSLSKAYPVSCLVHYDEALFILLQSLVQGSFTGTFDEIKLLNEHVL